MQRYLFELAYDGSSFCGWQKQPNAPTVQEAIELALSQLYSLAVVDVVGCGRTDAGVHAKHYVLHVDLAEIEQIDTFIFKLNRLLPASVVVQKVRAVSSEFHARFDPTSRTYRYFIHQFKDPFQTNSWHLPKILNFELMNQAALALLGTQDFSSLAKTHTDVKTHICTVSHAQWVLVENGAYFEITADRFLRNMVRASVGTLVDIGMEKLQVENLATILAAKDRQAASKSVPAHGLFLWEICYP